MKPKNRLILLTVSGLMIVSMVGASLAFAAGAFSSASDPTSQTKFHVKVGGGQADDFVNLQYTPLAINIYAGDWVTFTNSNPVEPHTVSFGPMKMLKKIANHSITPIPNKHGPPTLQFSNTIVDPSASHVYDGTGFITSGTLSPEYGKLTNTTWTVQFTKPGKYMYHCLIHFPFMAGWVIVHARPGLATSYNVQAGYGKAYSIADKFFPEDLTVHVGDTVTWSAFFHTVTLAPAAKIDALRHKFVLKSMRHGKVFYQINPAVAFTNNPNCGMVKQPPCAYTGAMLNSGLLQGGRNGPATYSVLFAKPGTYHYGCLVHPGMDGTIRVVVAPTRAK